MRTPHLEGFLLLFLFCCRPVLPLPPFRLASSLARPFPPRVLLVCVCGVGLGGCGLVGITLGPLFVLSSFFHPGLLNL